MTKSRKILAPRHVWSEADIAVMTQSYPDTPSAEIAARLGLALHIVYACARRLGLTKSAAYLASPAACRLRRGDNVGAAYRYPKGHVPANKGKHQPTTGRSGETQFKKGHINTGPRAELPLGFERVNSDGYLERKVRMDLKGALRWHAVHRLNWVAVNGEIPPGHSLAFKDGDKRNVAIDNLELITDQEKMLRNTIHNYPKDIVEVTLMRAAINRKINRRAKENEQRDKPSQP